MDGKQFGDNFIPVIPTNYSLHTFDAPFCSDPECPCHENQAAIAQLDQQRYDGLVSPADVDNIFHGRTV